jgi:hypothetical protein
MVHGAGTYPIQHHIVRLLTMVCRLETRDIFNWRSNARTQEQDLLCGQQAGSRHSPANRKL